MFVNEYLHVKYTAWGAGLDAKYIYKGVVYEIINNAE